MKKMFLGLLSIAAIALVTCGIMECRNLFMINTTPQTAITRVEYTDGEIADVDKEVPPGKVIYRDITNKDYNLYVWGSNITRDGYVFGLETREFAKLTTPVRKSSPIKQDAAGAQVGTSNQDVLFVIWLETMPDGTTALRVTGWPKYQEYLTTAGKAASDAEINRLSSEVLPGVSQALADFATILTGKFSRLVNENDAQNIKDFITKYLPIVREIYRLSQNKDEQGNYLMAKEAADVRENEPRNKLKEDSAAADKLLPSDFKVVEDLVTILADIYARSSDLKESEKNNAVRPTLKKYFSVVRAAKEKADAIKEDVKESGKSLSDYLEKLSKLKLQK